MATSNAQAVKKAIIDTLATALTPVQVVYAPPRDIEREIVYGGRINVAQKIEAGRTPEGNTTRDEDGTIDFHVSVNDPGGEQATVEARALEIGAALEEHLTLTTPDVEGLLNASVEGYELDSYADDDGVTAVLTYHVRIESTIQ